MARLLETSRKQVAFTTPARSRAKESLLWLTLLLTLTLLLPLSSAVGQTQTLYPTDDAYIIHGSPDYNTGTEPALIIRNDYGAGGSSGWACDALIKFDLSQYPNQTITSAKLKLFYYQWYDNNPAGRVLKLFRNMGDWNELTVTWGNQPDTAAQPTSSCAVPATTGTWMEFDVTEEVQAMVQGSISNYGWHLLDDNYWGGGNIPIIRLRSKEYGTTYSPRLEIIVEPPEPFYFVHLTDTHVGTTGAVKRFQYVINKINALPTPPEFVVISGDLVHLGKHVLYWTTFLSLIQQLNVPCYLSVGNHDHMLFPWWTEPWAIPLIPLFNNSDVCPTNNLHLISMNSGDNADWFQGFRLIWINLRLIPVPIIDRLPEGTGLSDEDYTSWLTDIIDDHPGYNKVIFMHHPVVLKESYHAYGSEYSEWRNGCITNHRQDLMNLCRAKEVKVVLSGHIHTPYEYTVNVSNQPIDLPDDPPGGYWSSNSVPDLPMYITTGACSEFLAYRRIEVVGNEVKVWEQQKFNVDNDLAEYNMDLIPWPWPGKEAQSLDQMGTHYAPGRLHVYDSHGNHVGINDTGGVDFEIEGAYYEDEPVLIDTTDTLFYTSGEIISLMLGSVESYTYELETFLPCTLNVRGNFIKKNGAGEFHSLYSNIEVDSGAIGKFFINNESIDYTLYMDDDGDGTVDREIQPDSVAGYLRGDANGDGVINVSDVVYLINYLFISGPAPNPLEAGDCNCDGNVNASDVVYLINYLFISGPPPGC